MELLYTKKSKQFFPMVGHCAQESNFELSSDPIKQKIYTERLQTYKSISAEIPLIYPNNVLYALRKEIS